MKNAVLELGLAAQSLAVKFEVHNFSRAISTTECTMATADLLKPSLNRGFPISFGEKE